MSDTKTMTTTSKTNELVIVPQADLDEIRKLDQYSRAAARQLVQAEIDKDEMSKGLILARSMKKLRELLTPKIMADVMELMGTPLGFRTDCDQEKKPEDKYGHEVVRDVLIQALIRGVRPTGNEFNIIASSLYITKEGFERLLRELPGLTDLSVQLGVPVVAEKGSLVPARARWRFHGRADEMICEKVGDSDYRIAVRVNAGMGVDAIIGKAESKLYRRIFKRITGTEVGIDPDEPATLTTSPT